MLGFLLYISDECNHPKIIEIYNRYHDDMIKFAKSRLRKSSGVYIFEAEDVVQESYIKILKYIDSINLDADEKAVKTYILTIVSNKINDLFSKCEICENIEDYVNNIESDDDFFEELVIKERVEAVWKAINGLDEIYRIIFMYRYKNHMSIKEIAEFMEISVRTVQTRILRGRKLLISILNEDNSYG